MSLLCGPWLVALGWGNCSGTDVKLGDLFPGHRGSPVSGTASSVSVLLVSVPW